MTGLSLGKGHAFGLCGGFYAMFSWVCGAQIKRGDVRIELDTGSPQHENSSGIPANGEKAGGRFGGG